MDDISLPLAVIAGFTVRFAIPIALTAIAIYFLRRLDTRWQAEAEEQFLVAGGEKPRCWEVNDCSPENRKSCPGYQSEQPCWQAFRKGNGYMQERCLSCDVFHQAPIPINI